MGKFNKTRHITHNTQLHPAALLALTASSSPSTAFCSWEKSECCCSQDSESLWKYSRSLSHQIVTTDNVQNHFCTNVVAKGSETGFLFFYKNASITISNIEICWIWSTESKSTNCPFQNIINYFMAIDAFMFYQTDVTDGTCKVISN